VTTTFAFDAEGTTAWSTSVPGLFGIMSYVEMDTLVGITDATGAIKGEWRFRGMRVLPLAVTAGA
jgi:hypothetical protein